jgi:hypothetical protein
MNQELFTKQYERFEEEPATIQLSMNTILAFEEFLGKDIEEATVKDIQVYMDHLIDTFSNKWNNVIHIARYFYYVDMKEHYIQMTKYFNSVGVLEHIIDRIGRYEGEDIKQAVLDDVYLPPFGTNPKELPDYTKRFIDILNKNLNKSSCNRILAGNNHQIPASSLDKEKEYYEQADSFEAYLTDRHKRKVAELQSHLDNNQIWFEQIITKEVVDFVKQNPEILSGVIKDDKLYITKIPYDVNRYLETEDETMKRYHACHCSFVKEHIKSEQLDIDKDWCYCSAGFAKFPFETILGQELEVALLQTPLDGDNLCRFAIDLSNVNYKK